MPVTTARVAVAHVRVGLDSEVVPSCAERAEHVLQHSLGTCVSAREGAARGLRPHDLRVEAREHCGDVSLGERRVEVVENGADLGLLTGGHVVLLSGYEELRCTRGST